MIFANLSRKNQRQVEEGLDLINNMKQEGDYFNAIKGLMELMEMFKEDTVFYKLVENLRDTAKDLWKAEIAKRKNPCCGCGSEKIKYTEMGGEKGVNMCGVCFGDE